MLTWRAAYPLIVLAGLLLSYLAMRRRYRASNLNDEQRTAIGLAAFIGAMIGAKAPFLISSASDHGILLWMADGKTILGGILGGYFAVECTKLMLGIRERTGDYFAVPIAIAVAFGRLGCFTSGCCFGAISDVPWAMHFPLSGDDSLITRHPTQLYEFGFHVIALAVLILLEAKGWLRGRRLTLYLLSYFAFRFVTEWLRPEPVWAWGLTGYQFACIGLASLLGLVELVHSWKGSQATERARMSMPEEHTRTGEAN